jgi:CMP-N,N'-diacetyllegionaminic acid synthase
VYSGFSIVGLVLARAGSKRLPDKNIKSFKGKPLIEWTLIAASKSRYLDALVVSTDLDLTSLVHKYHGIYRLRPPELATDTAPPEAAAKQALMSLKEDYDLVMLLQPTSPLRTYKDIDKAIEAYFRPVDALITFTRDLKPSGAIYLISNDALMNGRPFYDPDHAVIHFTPKEHEVDIDTLQDFEKAEKI